MHLAVLAAILSTGALMAQGTFQVASIRPSAPESRSLRFDPTADGGIRATGVSLRYLVHLAFDVEDFQISGGPAWTRSERFDIVATSGKPEEAGLPAELRSERLRARLRALLTARFQLRVQEDVREGSVYLLTQGRSGNKLNQPNGDAGLRRNRGLISSDNASMDMLSRAVAAALLQPVLDQTKLTGNYAFRLQWAEAGAPGEPEDPGPSLFTAIQDQLGLRLQPGRGPIRRISIEGVEKPSAN